MKLIIRSVEKRRQPRFGERCSIASQLTKPMPALGSWIPRTSWPSNGSPHGERGQHGLRAGAPQRLRGSPRLRRRTHERLRRAREPLEDALRRCPTEAATSTAQSSIAAPIGTPMPLPAGRRAAWLMPGSGDVKVTSKRDTARR